MPHLPDNLSPRVLRNEEDRIFPKPLKWSRRISCFWAWGDSTELAEKRRLDEAVRKQLEKDNAVAEACGYYFDGAGKVVCRLFVLLGLILMILINDLHYLRAGGKRRQKACLQSAIASNSIL